MHRHDALLNLITMKNLWKKQRFMRKMAWLGCAVVLSLSVLSSCKKDGSGNGDSPTQDCRKINEVTKKMTAAFDAFREDPEDREKCKLYVQSANEYVDFMEKCSFMTDAMREELDAIRNTSFCEDIYD